MVSGWAYMRCELLSPWLHFTLIWPWNTNIHNIMSIPTHSSFLTSSQSFCLKYPPSSLIPKLCLPLALDSEAFISWLFCTGNTKLMVFLQWVGDDPPIRSKLVCARGCKAKIYKSKHGCLGLVGDSNCSFLKHLNWLCPNCSYRHLCV